MPRTLVILLHAWAGAPAGLSEVADTVRRIIPEADVLAPAYPAAWYASADPARIAADLAQFIASAFAAGAYKETLLIGHSLGGLLLTKAFLYAAGAVTDLPVPSHSLQLSWRPWARSVRRMILFAGLLHGWTLPARGRQLPLLKWLAFKAVAALAMPTFVPLGPARLIASVRQASPFVNRVPGQWRSLARSDFLMPQITQLHGDRDELLTPENIRAPIPPIRYIAVPNAAHETIVQFSADEVRRALFVQALQSVDGVGI